MDYNKYITKKNIIGISLLLISVVLLSSFLTIIPSNMKVLNIDDDVYYADNGDSITINGNAITTYFNGDEKYDVVVYTPYSSGYVATTIVNDYNPSSTTWSFSGKYNVEASGTHMIVIMSSEGAQSSDYDFTIMPSSGASDSDGVGYLAISTSPSGAKCYIDGQYKGKTPTQDKLTSGDHTISLELDGYDDINDVQTVNDGKTTTKSYSFDGTNNDNDVVVEDELGSLNIYGSPTGASVYVNGDLYGSLSDEFELEDGTYNIKVTNTGYKDIAQYVNIVSGKTTNLYVELELESSNDDSTGTSDNDGENKTTEYILTGAIVVGVVAILFKKK